MSRQDVVAIIERTIREAVIKAGSFGVRTLPESNEQVALDVVDALEAAGYEIVHREKTD